MAYVKNILSILAAVSIAELATGLRSAFVGIDNSKAIGIDAVLVGLLESLFSPLFWLAAIALFAGFFSASRAGHRALRVIFFWIPTVTVCFVASAIVSLVAFLIVHFRSS